MMPGRRDVSTEVGSLGGIARSSGRQCAGSYFAPPRLDHRGLLARGRADVLASARDEARIRPGRPAMVVHVDAQLVRQPRPPGPHRGPAGPGGAAADDEDGAAHDLPAGRRRRGRGDAASGRPAARPRPHARQLDRRGRLATRSSFPENWSSRPSPPSTRSRRSASSSGSGARSSSPSTTP